MSSSTSTTSSLSSRSTGSVFPYGNPLTSQNQPKKSNKSQDSLVQAVASSTFSTSSNAVAPVYTSSPIIPPLGYSIATSVDSSKHVAPVPSIASSSNVSTSIASVKHFATILCPSMLSYEECMKDLGFPVPRLSQSKVVRSEDEIAKESAKILHEITLNLPCGRYESFNTLIQDLLPNNALLFDHAPGMLAFLSLNNAINGRLHQDERSEYPFAGKSYQFKASIKVLEVFLEYGTIWDQGQRKPVKELLWQKANDCISSVRHAEVLYLLGNAFPALVPTVPQDQTPTAIMSCWLIYRDFQRVLELLRQGPIKEPEILKIKEQLHRNFNIGINHLPIFQSLCSYIAKQIKTYDPELEYDKDLYEAIEPWANK